MFDTGIDTVSNTLFCLLTVYTDEWMYNRLPEDELSGSKHVEDVKIKNGNNLGTVHFVGLYCITV